MITTFQAIVLGLLQGLAEFLPISSSAHLALAPWLFGWRDPGLAFDVALHVGTLVALLWYFWGEWHALVRSAGHIVKTRKVATVEQWRVVFIIIATIPAALAGLLLNGLAESTFRGAALTAVMLIIMGVVLWLVDGRASSTRPITELRPRDAALIGLAQVFALIPGVSRSGSTITAGRALGFDRNSAAAFSFMLSMPITVAAIVLKVPEVVRDGGVTLPLVAGVVTSAVSGWLAIKIMLRYVSRHSYGIFALYRVVLGAVVLVFYAVRG